ncbi:hypothetical protein HQ576_10410 [bacterium]|nr:hypothetical protein [bacterium]
MAFHTRCALAEKIGEDVVCWTGRDLVNRIVQAHLAASPGEALGDLWSVVAEDYVAILRNEDSQEEGSARQSWRSASGKAFEGSVRLAVNAKLRGHGLLAAERSQLEAHHREVIRFLTLPAKRVCSQDNVDVWPDNDLIVVCQREDGTLQALAVISCKTSLRERVMQSLFWSLAIKVGIPVKSLFVTLDAQRELGSCAHPTKARRLVEAYFDATYVLNKSTSTCSAVRPFDALMGDLLRWRDDLAPNSMRKPLHL